MDFNITSKTVYLIDTENVNDLWVDVIRETSSRDQLVIFYTENSANMSLESVSALNGIGATITWKKCFIGTNALDFQLVSELGSMISKRPRDHYIIVANDTGYDAVVKYWTENGVKISRRAVKMDNSASKKSHHRGSRGRRHTLKKLEMQPKPKAIEEKPEALKKEAAKPLPQKQKAAKPLPQKQEAPKQKAAGQPEPKAEQEAAKPLPQKQEAPKQKAAGQPEPKTEQDAAGPLPQKQEGLKQKAVRQTVPGTEQEAARTKQDVSESKKNDTNVKRDEQNVPRSESKTQKRNGLKPQQEKKEEKISPKPAEPERVKPKEGKKDKLKKKGKKAKKKLACEAFPHEFEVKELAKSVDISDRGTFHDALVQVFGDGEANQIFRAIPAQVGWSDSARAVYLDNANGRRRSYVDLMLRSHDLGRNDRPKICELLKNVDPKDLSKLHQAFVDAFGAEIGSRYYNLFKGAARVVR